MKVWLLILGLFLPSMLFAQRPELVVQMGHFDDITSIDYASDEKYVITASKDRSLKLWEIATGKEVRTFTGHTAAVNVVVFSPDAQFAASASTDKTIKLWEVHTGKLLKTFKGHTDKIVGLDYSPDGNYLFSGSYDKTTKLWDVSSGKLIKKISKHLNKIGTVRYSNNGQYAFVSTEAMLGQNFVYSMPDGKQLRSFLGGRMRSAEFSADDKKLLLGHANITLSPWEKKPEKKAKQWYFKVWHAVNYQDTAEFKFMKMPDEYTKTASALACFSKDGQEHIIAGNEQGEILFFRDQDIKFPPRTHNPYAKLGGWARSSVAVPIKYIKAHKSAILHIIASPNGKYLLTSAKDRTMKLWDIKTGRLIRKFEGHVEPIQSVAISNNGQYALFSQSHNRWYMMDIRTGEYIYAFTSKKRGKIKFFALSPNKEFALLATRRSAYVRLWDLNKNKVLWETLGHEGAITKVAFSDDGQFGISQSEDGTEKVWDLTTGKPLSTKSITSQKFPSQAPDGSFSVTRKGTLGIIVKASGERIELAHQNRVNDICFTPDGKFVVTASDDGSIRLWDSKSGKASVRFILTKDYESIALTHDFYYHSSKGANKSLAFRYQEQMFPFQQFDLFYNRPDIVLQRIGYMPPALGKAFHQAYQKRMKQAGLKAVELNQEIHVPSLALLIDDIPLSTTERELQFSVKATDSKYLLEKIQVIVNDVPVREFILKDKNTKDLTQAIDIELGWGLNEVIVKSINEKGVESLPQTFEVVLNIPEQKPNLYLITIGVSEYQDAKQSLDYPAKDALKIAEVMKTSGIYNQVFVQPLINQQVTKERIQQLATFLAKASVDDVVTIFIAGHGMLDNNFDYVFGTYDIDFINPAQRGVYYSTFEQLLKGTKSRKKVLLMDTCHSGELDKDDLERSKKQRTKVEKDIKFRTIGDGVAYKSGMGLENINKLTQTLFSDVRVGTGATVISAAGGVEVAREGMGLNQGLFTFCVAMGLTERSADKDNNQKISINELQHYVIKRVNLLSKGLQTPTSRAENSVNDFIVW